MPLIKEDLEKDAYGSCHDIYNAYTKDEIEEFGPEIGLAWEVGRDIAFLMEVKKCE